MKGREFKHYFCSDGTLMVYCVQDGDKYDVEEPVTPFPNETFESMRDRGIQRLKAKLVGPDERREETNDNCGHTGAD